MKIYVFSDHINIPHKNQINTGEYQANIINFTFSSEYQNLVKKALFTRADGKTYQAIIANNACFIPPDVLEEPGTVIVGVYGYQLDGDDLVLRFSPSPSSIEIEQGSYIEDTENSSTPTPSELDELEQALAILDDKFDDYYTKTEVDNLIDSTFNTVMEGEY